MTNGMGHGRIGMRRVSLVRYLGNERRMYHQSSWQILGARKISRLAVHWLHGVELTGAVAFAATRGGTGHLPELP